MGGAEPRSGGGAGAGVGPARGWGRRGGGGRRAGGPAGRRRAGRLAGGPPGRVRRLILRYIRRLVDRKLHPAYFSVQKSKNVPQKKRPSPPHTPGSAR